MAGDVALDFTGDRAYVTLNRPDKHNALTLETLRALVRTAKAIDRRPAVRAVILSGRGPSFCSGLDITGTAKDPVGIVRSFVPPPWRRTNVFQEACWAWRRLPVPVIAAIHGRCYGGGLQLALAADFRIGTPDGEYAVLEGKWGLIPDMSGSVTLSRLIGIDQARRLTMTAEVISGFRAQEIGLITQITGDPLGAAADLADLIAARSPDSVAGAKRLFDATWSAPPSRSSVDGVEHLLDVLVLATGHDLFCEANSYRDGSILGRDGFDLAKFWKAEGMQAYAAVAVPRVPNRWILVGPYSWSGTGWHDLVELGATHAVRAISIARERGAATMEVRQEVHDAYHRKVHKQGEALRYYFGVQNAKVSTYYRNSQGDMPYIRPGSVFAARRHAESFEPSDYRYELAGAPALGDHESAAVSAGG
ncbi:hypothetical protein JMUB6875_31690 [Nocardia sp. JMUB6875]|uniref:crotonase/enoyl-CoA hydratase family protein n=1 Tax=Nocardia sp. JMUB6875 TaxID=3158170 RepID=UPI0032E58EF5